MELSMASCRSFGTCTWRTRPTNDSTSDTMKIRRCDFKIGMALCSQVFVRSGSIVAFGASYRAGSAPGTNRDLAPSAGQTGKCLHGVTAAFVFVFVAPFWFVWWFVW